MTITIISIAILITSFIISLYKLNIRINCLEEDVSRTKDYVRILETRERFRDILNSYFKKGYCFKNEKINELFINSKLGLGYFIGKTNDIKEVLEKTNDINKINIFILKKFLEVYDKFLKIESEVN